MRLLIVDDHMPMRRLLGRVVEDLFSAVEECDDGADALAAYERHRPDWVFMDIEMKRTDGLTATCDLVRAFPGAKVLLVSKHDDEGLREEARAAGARGYVLKENLIAIRELLEINLE